MITSASPVVIFGAGAIGCYVGAIWAAAGIPVTLLGRPSLNGLRDTGLGLSNGISVSPTGFDSNPKLETSPLCLKTAGLIVITVKSTALPDVIASITEHAAPDTPILCLLNGIKPIRDLRAAFPNRDIAAGMVPYNVVWRDAAHLQRSSVGDITLEDTAITRALSDHLTQAVEPITLSQDISAIQHGKLLLNLNNPINALSGLTLYHQLRQRPYRRAYAAVLEESLNVMNGAGIAHTQSGPLPAAKIVKMLRMPNWFFNTLVLPRQKLDPNSQTSMAQDLAAGKTTEIDTINGEILHIAQSTDQSAPIAEKLVALIKQAETGGRKQFSGAVLCTALGV